MNEVQRLRLALRGHWQIHNAWTTKRCSFLFFNRSQYLPRTWWCACFN